MQVAIREAEYDRLSEKMKSIEANQIEQSGAVIGKKPTKVKSLIPRQLSIAASLAAILVCGYFVFQFLQPSSKQLANKYFETYPNVSYNITRGDMNESVLRDAFVAYEEEDFETAATEFGQLIQTEDFVAEHPEIPFYLGNSYFNTKKINKAIKKFNISLASNEFVVESHWYLALCYMQLGEKEEAVQHLREVEQAQGFKQKEASQLLQN